MQNLKKRSLAGLLMLLLLSVGLVPAQAGDYILSNNAGSRSTVWFISGEPSLVMNGFDLTTRGLNLPLKLDRVSISVETGSNTPATVVVYQNAAGGSPVNATLLRQAEVTITSPGVFTYTFPEPVDITQPVIWVGFYLPVDFEFRADTSGRSALTYWAWEPGSRFDLANLRSASVLGPADGSAPVNINMNGVARITAELITDGRVAPGTTTSGVTGATSGGQASVRGSDPRITRDESGRIVQAFGGEANFNLLRVYDNEDCNAIFYDGADVSGSVYRGNVRWFCKLDDVAHAAKTPEGYTRYGPLFDVYLFGLEPSGTRRLPAPVTHCLYVPERFLTTAVVGLSYGAPREWVILPTIRYTSVFGDLICADIQYPGHVSYFVSN